MSQRIAFLEQNRDALTAGMEAMDGVTTSSP
ncbi:hypothetical protein M2275_006280 [Rhodococcus opacus]|nr:hypothetical protein [Rhodococcus opacus]